MSTKTLAATGPQTHTWPMAAGQARTSSWPRVAMQVTQIGTAQQQQSPQTPTWPWVAAQTHPSGLWWQREPWMLTDPDFQ